METADAVEQRLADNYLNPRAGDEQLRVSFEWMDVENATKSKEAGYPVYDRLEMVRIKAPGQLDENIVKVKDAHRERFARRYAAFKAGEEDPESGYPLKNWPPMAHARGEVEAYALSGVRTLEQLSAVTDARISALGHGAMKRRAAARAWLEQTKGRAPVAKLEAENADLKSKMETMARAIETLQKQAGIAPQPIVEAPRVAEPPLQAAEAPELPEPPEARPAPHRRHRKKTKELQP